jgi:acylphosphatase
MKKRRVEGDMMKKCVKITITGHGTESSFHAHVQKYAQTFLIEGFLQNDIDGSIIIHACGFIEKLDSFIDVLYQGTSSFKITQLIAEPLIAVKDYRHAFRIIEN